MEIDIFNYERLTVGFFDCRYCKNGECEKPNILCKDRGYCEVYNRLAKLENIIYKKGKREGINDN